MLRRSRPVGYDTARIMRDFGCGDKDIAASAPYAKRNFLLLRFRVRKSTDFLHCNPRQSAQTSPFQQQKRLFRSQNDPIAQSTCKKSSILHTLTVFQA